MFGLPLAHAGLPAKIRPSSVINARAHITLESFMGIAYLKGIFG
jgi:hypothetical protein